MAPRTGSLSTRARTLSRARHVLGCGVVLAVAVAATVGGSQAATSNVTVTLDVLSSTTMDPSGCPTAARGFGTVLPDSSMVTTAPCAITFGSSNNSSMLKLYQQDSTGDAMFARTDGAPDNTFSANSRHVVVFPEGDADAKWGAMQSDGQYIVGGHARTAGDQAIGLARISASGVLDPTFGDGATGRKVQNFYVDAGADGYEDETGAYGYVEPGGKIVGVGWTNWNDARLNDAIIYRFTAAGQPDPTFNGGSGVRLLDSAGWDEFWAVAPAAGGKYLAVGCSCAFGPSNVLLARFNNDGTPDTSFGTGGVIDAAWASNGSVIQSIAPLPSGKFIVGGNRDNGAGQHVYTARINADGSIDTTYGVSGFRDVQWLGSAQGNGRLSLATPDGGVWLPGHLANGGAGTDIGIARITAAGALDTTWNGTGLATAGYAGASNDYGYAAMALGGDDVLVVGGSAGTSDMHATAFTNGGTAGVDSGFSSDGKLLIDNAGGQDYAVQAFWGREGKLVLVGTGTDPTAGMAITVLAGGGTVPDYGGGAVFGSANTQSAFGACLEARSGAGVAGGWTVDPGGACTAVVGDPWNGIADTAASPTAKVLGSPTAGVTNATATIRFGVKTALTQTPRDYSAPLVLEVIAPDA